MGKKLEYEQNVKNIKQTIKDIAPNRSDAIIYKVFYENSNELFWEKKWAERPTSQIVDTGK